MILAVLLHRLLYIGRAHSFDAMLYARALWGLARGDSFNPVIGRDTFALHEHGGLVLLAPLARFVSPTAVLIAAQAVWYGASLALVGLAFRTAQLLTPGGALRWGLLAVVLAALGTPLLTNPFLFDVRPDLLGVPLLLAGQLRVVVRNRLDWLAAGLQLSAALMREEFGLVAAAGIAFAPVQGWSFTRRLWASSLGVLFFAGYFFVVRRQLGGDEASVLLHAAGTNTDLSSLLRTKAAFILLALSSMGGLAALGWRWWGAVVPGLALLLYTRWMPAQQLNFHYSMFVAPPLLVASVAGLRVLMRWRTPVFIRGALPLCIATAAYVFGSALPFGGRFAQSRFNTVDTHANLTWNPREASRSLYDEHALVRSFPPAAAIVVPHELGAPVAGRQRITTPSPFVDALRSGTEFPFEPDFVALYPQSWVGLGRYLTSQGGYRLAGVAGELAVVRRQVPGDTCLEKDLVRLHAAPLPCVGRGVSWSLLGLQLCGVQALRDGRLAATLARTDCTADQPGVTLLAVDPTRTSAPQALWVMEGLVPLSLIPGHSRVVAISDRPLDARLRSLVLVASTGRPIPTDDGQVAVAKWSP